MLPLKYYWIGLGENFIFEEVLGTIEKLQNDSTRALLAKNAYVKFFLTKDSTRNINIDNYHIQLPINSLNRAIHPSY